MDRQEQRKGWWTRRRFAGALAAGVVASGFVAARVVPHAREAAPSPGPLPTPTPTPSPTPPAVQAALPATPSGAAPPATPVAATPGPPLAPRAAGLLLYTGQLDGKDGIIAVNADGSDRRVLAPGFYAGVTWAPDASRFAAVGLQSRYGSPNQIAIFKADGTPLGRFPLEATLTGPLDWSPDARRLLCRVLSVAQGAPNTPAAWVLGDDGARQVALPGRGRANFNGRGGFRARTEVWDWTPRGRLAFISYPGFTNGATPSSAPSRTLWTVTADGGDPLLVARGDFQPLAWSADETILYALGLDRAIQEAPFYGASVATALLAINVTNGGQSRALITADELAPQFPDLTTDPATTRWLDQASIAPVGGAFAVVLTIDPPGGTPTAQEGERIVVLFDWTGQIVASERVAANAPTAFAWSPDGKRVACTLRVARTSTSELHLLAPDAAQPLVYPLNNLYPGASSWSPQWSPDSQWLAYPGPDGLTIAAATPPARSALLAPDANSAAWRPR
ncbi:MAG: hypothetical protein ACTHMA_13860 [Thermomicrobiales bacterium]